MIKPIGSKDDLALLKERSFLTSEENVEHLDLDFGNPAMLRWFQKKTGEGLGNRKVSKEMPAGNTYLKGVGILFARSFAANASRLAKTNTSPIKGPQSS